MKTLPGPMIPRERRQTEPAAAGPKKRTVAPGVVESERIIHHGPERVLLCAKDAAGIEVARAAERDDRVVRDQPLPALTVGGPETGTPQKNVKSLAQS